MPGAYVHCVEAFCLRVKQTQAWTRGRGQEKTCKSVSPRFSTPIGLWMTMRGPSRKLSRTKELWSPIKSREADINKHIQTLVAIHAIWSYDDANWGALCPRKDSGQRSSTFAFTNDLMLESFATRFWGLRIMAAMSLRLELAHKNHAISKTSLSCPLSWTTCFHPNLVGTFVEIYMSGLRWWVQWVPGFEQVDDELWLQVATKKHKGQADIAAKSPGVWKHALKSGNLKGFASAPCLPQSCWWCSWVTFRGIHAKSRGVFCWSCVSSSVRRRFTATSSVAAIHAKHKHEFSWEPRGWNSKRSWAQKFLKMTTSK